MNDDVDQALLRIAAAAVDDPGRASEQLTAWFGTSPNPTGERRLHEAPQAIPRVLAETMLRAGLDERGGSFWAPDFAEPGIPEEVQVIIRATARHLNGDPAVGDDLVRAHLAVTASAAAGRSRSPGWISSGPKSRSSAKTATLPRRGGAPR